MKLFAWIKQIFVPAPPPPLDEDPGFIGDIVRAGEAIGGDPSEAEREQRIADSQSTDITPK